MASPVPSGVVEKCLSCTFCSKLLQEPKLLPDCLHRICKHCLENLIRASPTKSFLCLTCKTEYVVPGNGVDGFKTDFLIREMIESSQNEPLPQRNNQKNPSGMSSSAPDASTSKLGTDHLPSEGNTNLSSNTDQYPDETTDLQEECVLIIEPIKTGNWVICGITSNSHGQIVLTGRVHTKRSFIMVMDVQGSISQRLELEGDPRSTWSNMRVCEFFSESLVATACLSGQVGIYNISDSAYNSRNMRDVLDAWPDNRYICSIAVDKAKSKILVGTKYRGGSGTHILVFDGELQFLHTLVLPEIVQYTGDMVVHNDNLFVCDKKTRRGFIFTLDESREKIVSVNEFTKPHRFCSYAIASVCIYTGHPYLLWAGVVKGQKGQHDRRIVRYSSDGSELQEEQAVDNNAFLMCSSKSDGIERIHVAAEHSGKVCTLAALPDDHDYLEPNDPGYEKTDSADRDTNTGAPKYVNLSRPYVRK